MLMPSIFEGSLFDDWGFPDKDFFDSRMPAGRSAGLMKTDIKENEGAYEIAIDVPGYKKEDVDIKLDRGVLTVSAVKSYDKEEDDKKSNYLRREHFEGRISRSFYIGEGIKQEDIKASMNNGVLALAVPKADAKQLEESKRILIE